ncbi:hypothetical protein [Streptomyces sp. NPDC059278]|uniref:hypothetical protein n=1 Tax=Streptomyces sp. NPDC059278 TaxID=3346801 RepID=UPI003683BADC
MSAEDTINDLRRELNKALGALLDCGNYLTHHAEMNAALHCASNRVMHSPLHAKVTAAVRDAHHALDRTTPHPPAPTDPETARRILTATPTAKGALAANPPAPLPVTLHIADLPPLHGTWHGTPRDTEPGCLTIEPVITFTTPTGQEAA